MLNISNMLNIVICWRTTDIVSTYKSFLACLSLSMIYNINLNLRMDILSNLIGAIK